MLKIDIGLKSFTLSSKFTDAFITKMRCSYDIEESGTVLDRYLYETYFKIVEPSLHFVMCIK